MHQKAMFHTATQALITVVYSEEGTAAVLRHQKMFPVVQIKKSHPSRQLLQQYRCLANGSHE